ncbi:hypothetical protein CUMW_151350 [Citrus unshiu]|nr:hypothetical protein CUMW_151350 [Citrus unshiu]
MVRNTVDMGRTVVCTIHQPSIDIFYSFDELFLLKQVGQEISVGPLGPSSIHLISYFEFQSPSVFLLSTLNRFARNCLLGHGNWLNNVGHTGVIHPAVRPLFTSTMAVMFGTVLIGTKGDIQQQQHLFNVMVSMYTAVLFLLVQNAGSLQLVAAVEWTIFYRESALGTYSAMPYALRK